MSQILRRIEKLKQAMHFGVVTLVMPGGARRQVTQRRIFWMISEASGEHLDGDTQSVIESVADNGSAVGMGRILELVKCLYAAGITARDAMTSKQEATQWI